MVKSMTRLMFLGLLPWLVTSPAHGQFAVGAVAPGVGGGAFGGGAFGGGAFGFGQAGSLGITGAGYSGVGLGFGSPGSGTGMGMGYGGYPYGARQVAPGMMYPPMTSRTTSVLGPLSQSIRRNVFPRRRR